jgi:hypothetical protein
LLDVSNSTQAWSGDVKLPATGAERRAAGRALGTQVLTLVMSSEQRRVLAAPIEQLSAPELSVRALAVFDRDSTLAGIDRALPLTGRALQLDPNPFIALNTKAYLLLNRYDEEATPDHDRYARELDALSSRELAIDPRDPLAWRNAPVRCDSTANGPPPSTPWTRWPSRSRTTRWARPPGSTGPTC